MYLIVGLGNPGATYDGTRHNAGAEALECFRATFDFPAWTHDKYLNALCSTGTLDEAHITLLFPQTMMNRSGEAVQAFLRRQPEDFIELVVVHDELDLPVGSLKMVFERGAGGHHGVESIIGVIGSNAFVRLRMGIAGQDRSEDVAPTKRGRDFVLSHFDATEQETMQTVFVKSVDVLATLVRDGREVAMQYCNTER